MKGNFPFPSFSHFFSPQTPNTAFRKASFAVCCSQPESPRSRSQARAQMPVPGPAALISKLLSGALPLPTAADVEEDEEEDDDEKAEGEAARPAAALPPLQPRAMAKAQAQQRA